jgi:hypothetical protein
MVSDNRPAVKDLIICDEVFTDETKESKVKGLDIINHIQNEMRSMVISERLWPVFCLLSDEENPEFSSFCSRIGVKYLLKKTNNDIRQLDKILLGELFI